MFKLPTDDVECYALDKLIERPELKQDELFLQRAMRLVTLLTSLDLENPYTSFNRVHEPDDLPECLPDLEVSISDYTIFEVTGHSFLLFEKLMESLIFNFDDEPSKNALQRFLNEVGEKHRASAAQAPDHFGEHDADFDFAFYTDEEADDGIWIHAGRSKNFNQTMFVPF